jgi:UDP:flavonoid glycosyltransferase YjiC (YdhE family)
LVCPIFADQGDNAMKVERLGVAKVLPYRNLSHGSLVRQLEGLLNDPEVQLQARKTAELQAGEDGAGTLAGRVIRRLSAGVAA